MAALSTAVADIYEPDLWNQYFTEETYAKSALITSGIAAPDMDLNDKVDEGGRVIDMPFNKALGHDSGTVDRSKVATDTDDLIVPDGLSTAKDIAHKDYRTQAWETANVVKYVSGDDPVAMFLDNYVEWWVREQQRILKKKLDGIFATALASTHVSDIAVESIAGQSAATQMGSAAIQTAKFLLGDKYSQLTAMVMHSAPYKRLEDLDLITMVPTSAQLTAPQIPYYFGIRVIVDDNMPVVAGGTDGFKYTTYLFAQGSVGFANAAIKEGNTDLYYDPRAGVGSGSTNLITRASFVMHPKGVAFVDTIAGLYPTDAELADGASWSKVYEDKGIGIIKLVTN